LKWWPKNTGYLEVEELIAFSNNSRTAPETPRIIEALDQLAEIAKERAQSRAAAASNSGRQGRPNQALQARQGQPERYLSPEDGGSSLSDPNYRPDTAIWRQPEIDAVRARLERKGHIIDGKYVINGRPLL